jgi:hypothetical protein
LIVKSLVVLTSNLQFPILAKYPKLRVTIQDLETVLPAAQQNLTSNWSQIDPSRVAYQTMDFFETNPTRGEDVVYMARWILHDWDDKDALRVSTPPCSLTSSCETETDTVD